MKNFRDIFIFFTLAIVSIINTTNNQTPLTSSDMLNTVYILSDKVDDLQKLVEDIDSTASINQDRIEELQERVSLLEKEVNDLKQRDKKRSIPVKNIVLRKKFNK